MYGRTTQAAVLLSWTNNRRAHLLHVPLELLGLHMSFTSRPVWSQKKRTIDTQRLTILFSNALLEGKACNYKYRMFQKFVTPCVHKKLEMSFIYLFVGLFYDAFSVTMTI
jgi:hypothetical protein